MAPRRRAYHALNWLYILICILPYGSCMCELYHMFENFNVWIYKSLYSDYTYIQSILFFTGKHWCFQQKSLQGTGTFLHTLILCGFVYGETQLVLAQNFYKNDIKSQESTQTLLWISVAFHYPLVQLDTWGIEWLEAWWHQILACHQWMHPEDKMPILLTTTLKPPTQQKLMVKILIRRTNHHHP